MGENGRVVEKGSYDELVAAKGYVSSLSSTTSQVDTERAPNLVLDDETLQELQLPDDDNLDASSRQIGDWSVYSYYFQHIGWPLLAIFLAFCGLFVVCMIAPRKLNVIPNISRSSPDLEIQKYGYRSGLLQMKRGPMRTLGIGSVDMLHLDYRLCWQLSCRHGLFKRLAYS